jgi:hypothetical protein
MLLACYYISPEEMHHLLFGDGVYPHWPYLKY